MDLYCYSSLNSVPLHDQARIQGISHYSCASAWLQAIPSEPLACLDGSLWLVFLFSGSVRCSCDVVLDVFGDHILS